MQTSYCAVKKAVNLLTTVKSQIQEIKNAIKPHRIYGIISD